MPSLAPELSQKSPKNMVLDKVLNISSILNLPSSYFRAKF